MGSRKIWIAIIVIVVVVFGIKWITTINGPSDEKLVQQALTNAIAASREGRPGGVMDYLSDNLKLNDQEPGRRQVIDFIKKARPDISVDHPEPVIRESDGTAQINSDVRVQLSLPGGSHFDKKIPNVTMKFERQDAREWLVIPTKQWRLVSVDVPTDAIPPDFYSGFSGF